MRRHMHIHPPFFEGCEAGATNLVVAPVFVSTKCWASLYKMGCLETLSTKCRPWIGMDRLIHYKMGTENGLQQGSDCIVFFNQNSFRRLFSSII